MQRGLYLQVLVLVLAPAREKGAREYLCCTVPEGALETVEMARGQSSSSSGGAAAAAGSAARSRHVMAAKVRAARPMSARTGG